MSSISILQPQNVSYKGKIINAQELPHGSSVKIWCCCDICGEKVLKITKQYYNCIKKHNNKYICKKCFNNNEQLLLQRKEQTKNTCFQKYGVDNPTKTKEVKEKMKNTCLEKYGASFSGQIKEGIEKRKSTCLKKYGVTNPLVMANHENAYTKEAREKAVETTRKRYGKIGFENEKTREKARNTLLNSGKVITSSQQIYIYNIVKKLFPTSECILNKPESSLALDIYLKVGNISVDIEVDGKYWHQDYQKDRRRDEFVKKLGYKVLRINFEKMVPSNKELQNAINSLLYTNHTYNELILKDYKK